MVVRFKKMTAKTKLALSLSLITVVASIVMNGKLVDNMLIWSTGASQVLTKEGDFFCRSILPMALYSPCVYMSSHYSRENTVVKICNVTLSSDRVFKYRFCVYHYLLGGTGTSEHQNIASKIKMKTINPTYVLANDSNHLPKKLFFNFYGFLIIVVVFITLYSNCCFCHCG